MPLHLQKGTLDEVDVNDGDEGLEYVKDAYASEDADVISSNGADDYGDGVNIKQTNVVSQNDRSRDVIPSAFLPQPPSVGVFPTLSPPLREAQLGSTSISRLIELQETL